MKTAIKVILILTLVYLPFMLLFGVIDMATSTSSAAPAIGISAIVSFVVATPVTIVALIKLKNAKSRQDLKVIGILTLLFGQVFAGILMLTITDAALNPTAYKSPFAQPPYGAYGPYGQGNVPPYGAPYGQGNVPPYGTPYGQGNVPPYGAPYGQGNVPPYGAPYGQGNVPPYGAPYGQGNVPPYGAPYGSPYGNPQGGKPGETAEAPATANTATTPPVDKAAEVHTTETPAPESMPEVTVDTVVEVPGGIAVEDSPTVNEVTESVDTVENGGGEVPH